MRKPADTPAKKQPQPATEAATPPASLRERQRRMGSKTILDAACDLFTSQGYRKTTMQAIADRAGVGIATVFRYFQSKGGILAAISRRDLDTVLAAGARIVQTPPQDPVKATLELFMAILQIVDLPGSQFRWQTNLWLPVPTGHEEADAVVSWGDKQVQNLIYKLMAHFRAGGRIDPNIDLDDLTALLFSVFNQHFINFATTPSLTMPQLKAELNRRVPLLFDAWRVTL